MSLKRSSVGGESWEEGGGEEGGGVTEDRRIPKLKVKLGSLSDSAGEVKMKSGGVSDAGSGVGVKVGRRLSRSSKTPEAEDSDHR